MICLLQAVIIYGIGLTISIPTTQIAPMSHTLASHLQHNWPQIRPYAEGTIDPMIRQQVDNLVNGIHFSVAGQDMTPPRETKAALAHELNRIVQQRVAAYLDRKAVPKKLLSPQLIAQVMRQPFTLKVWVHVGILPVPVTVKIP